MAILVLRHVEIEALGIIAEMLEKRKIPFVYKGIEDIENQYLVNKKEWESYDGLIILGGFMGVYEEKDYPFITLEKKLILHYIKEKKPIFGICLGAQMIASALGKRVYKGEKGEEWGWMEIFKTKEAEKHPLFKDLPQRFKVFQWHQDTFELPEGAIPLFSSEKYQNQGFVYQNNVYAFQFHIELDKKFIEQWFIEYNIEPEKGKPQLLETPQHTPLTRKLCEKIIEEIFTQ